MDKKIILALSFVLMGLGSTVFCETWPNYQEIPNPAIQRSIESMQTHQRQWNLSMLYTLNLDTPGYIEQGNYNHSVNGKLENVPFFRFRTGTPMETGREMDFMVDGASGRAFFCVRLPTGKVGYTRDGRFRLDKNRRVVMMAGGFPVLNEGEQDIVLPPGTDFSVSKSGLIFVNNSAVDKFKIVVFNNDKSMNKFLQTINGTILYAVATPEYDPEPSYAVRQGYLEGSNVYKGTIGDMMFIKYANEGSAKVARSHIKTMNSAIQMANP